MYQFPLIGGYFAMQNVFAASIEAPFKMMEFAMSVWFPKPAK